MNAPARKSARSRWLAGLAVLALALMISLMLMLGDGGCTPAVAFDRPIVEEPPRAEVELSRAPAVPVPSETPRAPRATTPAGNVRGGVFDSATREVVPLVEVRLSCGALHEVVLAGPDGGFAATVSFPDGELTASVYDDGQHVGDATVKHAAARGTIDWRVEVPIGPTVPIALVHAGVVDESQWRARITQSALKPGVAGVIDVQEEQLVLRAPGPESPEREWSWIRLRPGPTPWIRYARHEHSDPRLLARVEVRSGDLLRKGSEPIRSTEGVQRTVEIRTTAFGGVRARIEAPARERNAALRAVLFDNRDASGKAGSDAPRFEEGSDTTVGRLTFEDVEPGRKTLVAWSRNALASKSFNVKSGDWTDVELRARVAGEDSVAPEVRTPFVGWSGPSERFVIAPSESNGFARAWAGSIETIEAESRGFPEWFGLDRSPQLSTHAATLLTPGRSESWKLVEREIRLLSWNGTAMLAADVAFGPRGRIFLADSAAAPTRFQVPERLEFTWSAWASGYQPTFGTEADFTHGDASLRVAEARMEPGFGTQILLRAGDPAAIARDPWPWPEPVDSTNRAQLAALAAPALPGIGLQIDGMPGGRSDAHGELRVRSPLLPRRLVLFSSKWKVCALDRLPGPGLRYVAWLK